jgi:hypothetical protein
MLPAYRHTGEEMKRNALKALGAVLFLLAITRPLRSEDDLAIAHSLATKLWQQRVGATTKEARETLQAEMGGVVDRIQAHASRGVLALLNSANPPSTEHLQEALRLGLSATDEPQSGNASVLKFMEPTNPLYVVAYAVGFCAVCSRSRLEVIGIRRGSYQDIAVIEDPLPNRSLALLPLDLLRGGRIRFLADGVNWGDPHGRLTVIAYAFDGVRLNNSWSRADLPQGMVRVQGDRILLSYLTSLAPPWRTPSKEKTDVYRLTDGAIELQTSPSKAATKHQ